MKFNFDFTRMKKKLNKAEATKTKAFNAMLDHAGKLEKSNNALVTMKADVEVKVERYNDVHSAITNKVDSNNALIAKMKGMIS